MDSNTLIAIWLGIVIPLAFFAAFIIPLTAWQKADNKRRIEELMDAHERNLRSPDPQTRAQSRERWKTMCQMCQRSNPRFAALWLDLERWGENAG